MKIRAGLDLGHPHRPYLRSCDELCNTVVTLAVPFVGYVSFYSERAKFSDGLWATSGSCGTTLSVYTYGDDEDSLVTANLPMLSLDEVEAAFGDDTDHPRIWIDAEVHDLATVYETCLEFESFDFRELSAAEAFVLLGRATPALTAA